MYVDGARMMGNSVFPQGEIMIRMGYWVPVIAAGLILVTLVASRRRFMENLYLRRLFVAMSLLCLGMIIGPLPWALDRGSGSLRSAASMMSIAASSSALLLMAFALVARWRAADSRRRDGDASRQNASP
jgi:hypothetical protein